MKRKELKDFFILNFDKTNSFDYLLTLVDPSPLDFIFYFIYPSNYEIF